MINWIKTNLRILRVLNSCDRKEFESFLSEFISEEKTFHKLFYSKWYLWNLIRGRDFYKMLSHYVITQLQLTDDEPSRYYNAEAIIKMVEDTAKSEAVIRNFIWAVMKQVPLLTTTTIKYASPEKIRIILSSDKRVIADNQIVSGVLVVIHQYKQEISELRDQLNAYQIMHDE